MAAIIQLDKIITSDITKPISVRVGQIMTVEDHPRPHAMAGSKTPLRMAMTFASRKRAASW